LKSYNLIAKDKDVMLIGGYGSIYTGSYLGLQGLDVIKRLDAKVVLLSSTKVSTLLIIFFRPKRISRSGFSVSY